MKKLIYYFVLILLTFAIYSFFKNRSSPDVLGTDVLVTDSAAYKTRNFLESDLTEFMYTIMTNLKLGNSSFGETVFKWEKEGAISEVLGKSINTNLTVEDIADQLLKNGFIQSSLNTTKETTAYIKNNIGCFVSYIESAKQTQLRCGLVN